jgi:hypothetical protein
MASVMAEAAGTLTPRHQRRCPPIPGLPCLRRLNPRAILPPRHAAESWLTLTMMTISSDSDEGIVVP